MFTYQSKFHSGTFPDMSWRPQAFGASSPTWWVSPPLVSFVHATSSMVSDPAYSYSSPARAAYSHSASVGGRYPSHR